MKKRLLYYELVKYLNHKNALLITGMRQVGKTTRWMIPMIRIGNNACIFPQQSGIQESHF